MNDTEIQRLAHAANALRPDWPVQSLLTWLHGRHAGRAYPDAARALVWIATDPATRTPKRMDGAGPWWQGTTGGNELLQPPRLNERCKTHLGWGANCPGCRADAIAATDDVA